MRCFLRKLTLVFAAGALGGLTNSVTLWLCGAAGITAALGVKMAPLWTPPWLYPRIVWGGIWGVLFLLPILKTTAFKRGLVFGLGPVIGQLFVVFPLKGKGVIGLQLGTFTLLFVMLANAVWGLTASYWLRLVESKH